MPPDAIPLPPLPPLLEFSVGVGLIDLVAVKETVAARFGVEVGVNDASGLFSDEEADGDGGIKEDDDVRLLPMLGVDELDDVRLLPMLGVDELEGVGVGVVEVVAVGDDEEDDKEGISDDDDVRLLPVLGVDELLAVIVEVFVCVGSLEGDSDAVSVGVAEEVTVAVADC